MAVVTGVVLLFGVTEVRAQVLSGGVAPIRNAAAAGARSPGQMVTAGIGRRAENLAPPTGSFVNISTPEVPDLLEGFRSTASVVLATQLVIAIDLIVDSLIDRSGILDTLRNAKTAPAPSDTGGRTPARGKLQR